MPHSALLLGAICIAALSTVAAVASAEETKQNQAAVSLLQVPIGGYVIGGGPRGEQPRNPFEGNRQAMVEGRKLFDAMNCSGCHAPEGGGGMGPPLSDHQWIYGSSSGNIFLTISQGRPNGMPSFENLGPETIWKLVLYVRSLSGLRP